MQIISKPLGWVLAQLSVLLNNNFAASVLIFTILVNLVMLPLTIKTQKSNAKRTRLNAKLDALKKKCGDDKQKYQKEMSELYAKENISMTGGCLPMVVRLFVMIGVYWAVVSPFTYVLNIDTNAISKAAEWTAYTRVVAENAYTVEEGELNFVLSNEDFLAEAEKIGYTDREGIEKYAKMYYISCNGDKDDIAKVVKDKKVVREVEIGNYIIGSNSEPAVVAAFTENGGDVEKLGEIDFNMFGFDLKESPNFSWNFSNMDKYWLFPLVSFITALLTSLITSYTQKKTNPETPSMLGMTLFTAVFSLIIAFSVPAAVGFYWICSNVISGGLNIVMQIMYNPNRVVAGIQARSIIDRAKAEKQRLTRKDI